MTELTSDAVLHHPDATEDFWADFTCVLEVSGRTLTGTPTVAEQTTSDLTITDVATNPAAITRTNGKVIDADKAVVFKVAGGTSGTTYILTVTAATTGSETLVRNFTIECSST